MKHEGRALSTPPPLTTREGSGGRRRAFWRSPLGILTATGVGLSALVFVGLMSIGVAMRMGYLPDTVAVSGDRVSDHLLAILRDADIIEPDEKVRYFYCDALLDFLEDGNLFTERRVISYWCDGSELLIDSAAYDEIEDITVQWADSWLDNTEITVVCEGGDQFVLYVASEEGGDRKFHADLKLLWGQHR